MAEILRRYKHIVLGAGGIGSATAHWLAAAGETSVLCVEQFDLLHEKGASKDFSRIIRHAYHDTAYTNLTQAAYDTWGEIEEATGLTLVHRVGGVDVGREMHVAKRAPALAAAGHDFEYLDSREFMKRWPQWHVRDTDVALYQKDSGILDIRAGTYAHIALAKQAGVTFVDNTPVGAIHEYGDRVEVVTDQGVFVGDHLSVCSGSWSPMLFESLGQRNPLQVSHEQVCYWATPNLSDFSTANFGIWIHHDDVDNFYGFPVFGLPGTKAGRDTPHDLIDPANRSYQVREDNLVELEAFMTERLPGALGPRIYARPCCYDLTPDRDFVIDHVAGSDRVAILCGAGHGAKFASLMGKIMAQLATDGESTFPIEAFRWDRPAITDPDFEFLPPVKSRLNPHAL